ncbi:MAG: hypothetical protein IK056_03185 [Clostridia bacterium]|nr:hypothetical protein [Clostridia bacterium]
MKKVFLLMALLLLTAWAGAETVYAGEGEIYYHAIPDCMGRAYTETADSSGLYPCPVCVQDENEYEGLEVFTIAGLTVIRMPDAWMAAQTDTEEIFAYTEEIEYTGEEAEARVAEYLHGDAYVEFKNTVRNGGTAENTARYMDNYTRNCDRCQTVHMGGTWYDVYGNMWYPSPYDNDLDFRFFLGPMSQTGETLKEYIRDEYDDFFTDGFKYPELTVLTDAPIWSADIEGATANIYFTHGFYLFTLRITGKDALLMPKLTLEGPNWPASVEVLAADADGDALYGAVLSQGQAETLMRGEADVHWTRFSLLRFGTGDEPFSVFETEQEFREYFVVDSEGNEVLRSDGYIRQDGSVFLAAESMPRSAYEAIGFVHEDGYYSGDFCTLTLYNAAQDEVLLRADYHLYYCFAESFYHGFDCNTRMDVILYAGEEAEKLAVLGGNYVGRDTYTGMPYPDTSIVIYDYAVAYFGYYADGLPTVPDDCFAFRISSGWAYNNPELSCVIVVWNLEGGEPPTAEELGFDENRWLKVG